MADMDFKTAFHKLTGNPPFPWQEDLYQRFIANKIPTSCILPTGLGKTSVIAIWLIALAQGAKVPRRLVYVVNRRTVVDQTTDEVEKYKKRTVSGIPEFAISTLRGQFADNREWSEDPSRPAVICGTVDMIGSRLLFSGYGVGMKAKPLHAGFLGQDALLVHDEAHLEPAFQLLLLAIESEQSEERADKLYITWPQLQVMELTATPRNDGEVFGLTDAEKNVPAEIPETPTEPIHRVWKRISAKKSLVLHEMADEKKELVSKVVELGLKYKDHNKLPAILIFMRTVDSVLKVVEGLKKGKINNDNIVTLTGTMRGYERDKMTTDNGVFARFKKDSPAKKTEGTVYLVCTSAGEVGVDISADHMVCDLSTYESMAQRFGRVNRYGDNDATIDVIHPKAFTTKDDSYETARERTLALLKPLSSVSPATLGSLDQEKVLAAFAPVPTILPVTDILFDAWALTTIKGKLPGRPMVEPYLHGLPVDWQPPETQVAWREEVEELAPKSDSMEERKSLEKLAPSLLEDFPLKPHEILKDNMNRVRDTIDALADKHPDKLAWVVSEDDDVRIVTLKELKETEKRDGKTAYKIDSRYCTILLPPSVGGLSEQGMLDAASQSTKQKDVSCEWFEDKEKTIRRRVRKKDIKEGENDHEEIVVTNDMRLIRCIELPTEGGDDAKPRYWCWYVWKNNEGDKSAKDPVLLTIHVHDVVEQMKKILETLSLEKRLKNLLILAAKLHDHGKGRNLFQRVLGNPNPDHKEGWLAKSGGKRGHRVSETYRHEFGSLLDALHEPEFQKLSEDEKEFVLHLIATHHGRGRPHFPTDEVFDPKRPLDDAERMAAEVPRRFARLQRKYGRWGLAYLESLLRAADWAASADPSEFVEEKS